MIKAIIFDFDNTLNNWDNIQTDVEIHIVKKISRKHKVNTKYLMDHLAEIRARHYMDKSPKVAYNRELWFKELFKHFKIKDNAKKIVEEYWDYGLKKVQALPGSKTTLAALKKKYKIGMLTDSDGEKRFKIHRIKKLGMYDYFDAIVPTDDVGFNKPHVRGFRYVLKKLGVKASECVMVGDHPEADLITAKKLGMKTVWTVHAFDRKGKYAYVDYRIHKIGQLLDIIKKLDKPVKNTKRKAKKS
ncbi:MAG: HAD family hydrolase [archaeon]